MRNKNVELSTISKYYFYDSPTHPSPHLNIRTRQLLRPEEYLHCACLGLRDRGHKVQCVILE